MNHINTAHLLWKDHILTRIEKLKDRRCCLVDATCGNGHDSLFLSQFNNCSLHCIDIQKKAIENSKALLPKNSAIKFYHQSHENLININDPIDLIIYNLGYLPGSDKKIMTRGESTIKSLASALKKLSSGGVISITIYTGHSGGKEEEKAILDFTDNLSCQYKVMMMSFLNKQNHPYTLFIKSI